MAVTGFEVQQEKEFASGESFAGYGPYRQIEGRVHFEVDPALPANAAIVDLQHAVNTACGEVAFSADFSLVTPKNPAKGTGKLLIDVPNRGNRLASTTLQRVAAIHAEDRLKPGDAFLCRRGFSYMAVGWQWDAQGEQALRLQAPVAKLNGAEIRGKVLAKLQSAANRDYLALVQLGQTTPSYPVMDPKSDANKLFVRAHENAPRAEIPRDRWRFARVTNGEVVPSDRHICLDGGFVKGLIYELVYGAEGAPVVGAGLLSVRDVATCLAHGDATSLLPRRFENTYGFGVSQTGRFLRQFLFDGMNVDEQGRKVFDGMWIHIAGAQRGDFNFRFAQPTVATIPSLGQRFPFSTSAARDLYSERSAGLLDALAARHRPKIVISNTSWEYWRGDAALAHILGDQDLPEDENTRIYHIAGTHHIGGILVGGQQMTEIAATGLKVASPLNVVNSAPVSRALLVLLDQWVTEGIPPPASRHPRITDGTAVTREAVLAEFAKLPDVALLAPEKLQSIKCQVAKPENDDGVVDHPVEETEAYPCYVSALNGELNETAGIQLPDLAVPLGTHSGWNARAAGTGGEDQAAIFAGFTLFFPRSEIDKRYAGEASYLDAVAGQTDRLIAARFVLPEDRDWMIELARDRYRAATRKRSLRPT